MGKKHRNNKKHQLKNLLKRENLPLVTLCTPTYNRRPFIKQCINNMLKQTYPLDKLEWIVVDDGFDKVGDLFSDVKDINVRYISFDEKMTLGKKRNLIHKEATGKILIYIDDDDYYVPDRVLYAVTELLKSKKLIAGSSELHIWFDDDGIHKFGPYGVNHATAGTFAFKKELLNMTSYVDDACFAEEKKFLQNYTIPLLQLNPNKVMLVFNHLHNTIDKKQFITGGNKYVKRSEFNVSDFIKDEEALKFYTETIHKLLADYDPGFSKHKPDLIEALNKLNVPYRNLTHEESDSLTNSTQKNNSNNNQTNNPETDPDKMVVRHIDNNGNEKILTKMDLVSIINQLKERDGELVSTIKTQNEKMTEMSLVIEEKNEEIDEIDKELEEKNKEIIKLNNELIKPKHDEDNVLYTNKDGNTVNLSKGNLVEIIKQYQTKLTEQIEQNNMLREKLESIRNALN
tara:strand:+ start:1106 stop:2476 length:1371 start_codon:yes stop_codon:yes gene_type:complete